MSFLGIARTAFSFSTAVCYTTACGIRVPRHFVQAGGEHVTEETGNYQSPKYRQLLERLRSAIMEGEYQIHDRIPSEKELGEKYEVSRVTVRRALKELSDEGLLERHQGKGTFVSMPRIQRDVRSVTSFHASCELMGLHGSAKVLSARYVAATREDITALGCEEDHEIVEIRRLCLADDMPVMLEINHFARRYEWLLQEDLNTSLYAILASHKIEPGKAMHEISLCRADAEDAAWLETEEGEALLRVAETIYDQKGRPLHTSQQHVRGDRFTFRI